MFVTVVNLCALVDLLGDFFFWITACFVYESRSAVVECGFGLLDTGAMGGRGAPRQRFLPTSGKGEAWGVFLLFFFLAEHSGERADRAAARKLQK